MKDGEIIRLLHEWKLTTFFTRDDGFFARRLCHQGYCLVYLDIDCDVAEFVRRTLRHSDFNARAKRMGTVVRVSPERLHVWRKHVTRQLTTVNCVRLRCHDRGRGVPHTRTTHSMSAAA